MEYRFDSNPKKRFASQDATTALLRERVRIAAFILIALQVVFALADLQLNPERFFPLFALKLAPATAATILLLVVRRSESRRTYIRWVLVMTTVASLSSAVSGIFTNDAATTPVILLSGAFGLALLLPWGPGPQAWTALAAAAAMLVNQYAVNGTFQLSYASLAMFLALLASVLTVHLLDRYRTALAAQRRQLEAQNAELDAYARTVAHDLKSPIHIVAGYTELLGMKLEGCLDQEAQGYLRGAEQGCAKLTEITDALLLLARVRKADDIVRQPLDTARIVGEACKRLADKIAQSQAEIIFPPDWPIAIGHPAWIEEVWSNYISNAIKYGGSPPRIELGAGDSRDGSIRFWVRDNGPGLDDKQLGVLFREFSRLTPAKAEGHGLGLSIVKRIVEKLGGQVGASSEPRHGSVFYFTLPAAHTTAT